MLDRYQDMLDLARPTSPSHAPMRRRDRAAQFAPFAALTGFDEQIREAGKLPVLLRPENPRRAQKEASL